MMSTVTEMMGEPPAAVQAGADLREARERLGLSLLDVAGELRIRPSYLEALEAGHLSLLPGNAYAVAFMRTYAQSLGLDAEEMVRRFKAEAAGVDRRTELVFPIPMPDRGFPAGAVVLLGLVLAVGAYTGWYRLSGEGRLPAETVTAIPERLAPLADQALPPVSPVVADASVPASAPPAPLIVQTSTVPPDAVVPPEAVVADVPIVSPPVEPPSIGAAQAATVSPGAADSRIVLRASSDAWMLLKDRSGAVLLNRVLKAGETWSVPPRQDLLLSTGNAGGTEILVDGVLTPGIGVPGGVRRDLSLDPQAIKDGKLAAALSSAGASARAHQ